MGIDQCSQVNSLEGVNALMLYSLTAANLGVANLNAVSLNAVNLNAANLLLQI